MLKLDVSSKRLKGFESMKHLLSKTPTYIVVAVIIVLTVSLTLVAAAVADVIYTDLSTTPGVDNLLSDVVNGNSSILNIIDYINNYSPDKGWTTGIY